MLYIPEIQSFVTQIKTARLSQRQKRYETSCLTTGDHGPSFLRNFCRSCRLSSCLYTVSKRISNSTGYYDQVEACFGQ